MTTMSSNVDMFPGSVISTQLLSGVWDTLHMQLTVFNTANVVAMPSSMFLTLDDGAKQYLLSRMEEHTGLRAMLIRDGTHFDRYILGPVENILGIPNVELINVNGEAVFVLRPDSPELELEQEPESTPEVEHRTSTTRRAARHRIPRPPNAYILYRKDNHHKVKAENPGIHNNEISVILGSRWNNETQEVRDQYAAKAERVKQEFMKENPNYKYNPRRPEEKKRRAKRVKVEGTIAEGRSLTIGGLDAAHLDGLQEQENSASTGTTPSPQQDVHLEISPETTESQDFDLLQFNAAVEQYYIGLESSFEIPDISFE
ncbi:hypothetical protein VTK73DRAFT_4923 [Phialemonium thermophilum]|uniref:HMG box domain-containing protein n=1 Tax=Phialemonium thermophilum TaxID=223376 RepID=A0ABR3WQZ0_9PEZI